MDHNHLPPRPRPDPRIVLYPQFIYMAGVLFLIGAMICLNMTTGCDRIPPYENRPKKNGCNQLQPLPPDQQPSTTSHTSTCPSPYPSTWVVNLAPRRGISHYYTFETAQSRPRPTPQNDEKNTGGPGLQQISGRCWGDLATAINCIGCGGCRGARFEGLGRVEAWWVWGDLGVWGASGGDELQVREP